ncbi:MAG TPA: NAD(P)-dependent oxidoreductase, partial [Methylocystis sp.]|nr:NAD(P)-dependent oxidoreductase [Methylocystis sp.]
MTRTADEIPYERMQPLERLPVFFDLAGKRVVVFGETEAVAWKVDLLAAAGAVVEALGPAPCAALREVAAARENVTILARGWTAQDFMGAAMIVAAAADEPEAHSLAQAAKAAGAPVNIVDRPKFSDFSFGAIVNRSPLVIGVSTGGA